MKLILLRSCRAGTHFSVRGKVGKRRNGGGVSTLPPPYTSPATTKGSSPFGILRLPTHCVALELFQRFPLFASVCCLFSVSANGHEIPTKVFVHLFQKVADSKGRAFGDSGTPSTSITAKKYWVMVSGLCSILWHSHQCTVSTKAEDT